MIVPSFFVLIEFLEIVIRSYLHTIFRIYVYGVRLTPLCSIPFQSWLFIMQVMEISLFDLLCCLFYFFCMFMFIGVMQFFHKIVFVFAHSLFYFVKSFNLCVYFWNFFNTQNYFSFVIRLHRILFLFLTGNFYFFILTLKKRWFKILCHHSRWMLKMHFMFRFDWMFFKIFNVVLVFFFFDIFSMLFHLFMGCHMQVYCFNDELKLSTHGWHESIDRVIIKTSLMTNIEHTVTTLFVSLYFGSLTWGDWQNGSIVSMLAIVWCRKYCDAWWVLFITSPPVEFVTISLLLMCSN